MLYLVNLTMNPTMNLLDMIDTNALKETTQRFFIDSFMQEKDHTKLLRILNLASLIPLNESIVMLTDFMIVPETIVIKFLQNCVANNTPIKNITDLVKNICTIDEKSLEIYDQMLREEQTQIKVEDDLNKIFELYPDLHKLISLMNENDFNTTLYIFCIMLLPCHYPPLKSYIKIYEAKRKFFETILNRMNKAVNFNTEMENIAKEDLTNLKFQITQSV